MRLIDADNVFNALGVFSDMEHGDKNFLHGINSAKEIINECATIDAAPVVRCKDGSRDKGGSMMCYVWGIIGAVVIGVLAGILVAWWQDK